MKLIMMIPIWCRKSLIRTAVNEVLTNHIVAGIKDLDNRTRVMQWEFIRQLIEPPKTITLGSSRAFYIRSKHIDGSYFNHAVGACMLQDISAILMMYQLRHRRLPKRIILSLDPWMFNMNSGIFRWKYLYNYHRMMLKELKLYPQYLHSKIFGTLDTWLIRDATTSIFHYYIPSNPISYKVVENTDVDDWLIMPDGSVHYPYFYRYTPHDKAQDKANLDPKHRVFGLENFINISYTELFVKLISYIKERGSQIVLFIHPYHPDTYRAFTKHPNYRIIENLEEYIRLTARDMGLTIIGSFDGNRLGFDPELFFDKMHGVEEVTDLLLTQQSGLN